VLAVSEIDIPASLGWWHASPGGSEWLARLPRLAAECAEQWGLVLGPAFPAGNVSLVLAAGDDAVLKIGFPDPESEHEAGVLELWDGNGAVRLLAHDPARSALLLERCRPGSPLLELDEAAAENVVVDLLGRLSVSPPPQLPRLADLAARWVDELPLTWMRCGRPFERTILDAAVAALAELGPTQGSLVTANQDLHAGNVLSATREPWLVIDPKPIAAEHEFTPVAMIRDRKEEVLAGTRPRERLRRRLARLSTDLALDRERVRGWTLAHTIAWGFDAGGAIPSHVEIARLLLE
jgi:streptomycin 6-kinase